MLIKYFSQVGEMWQIAPEIRAMVKFQPLNLLHDFSSLGMFDVVFCRNVLIYFDQETKIDVLNRIAEVIERDGFLVLGGAETVVGLTHAFKPIADKRGLYAPNPTGKSAPARTSNVVRLVPAARRYAQRALDAAALWFQHDLPDRTARLDKIVRACRLGERERCRDRRLDAARQQFDRGLHRLAARLLHVIVGVHGEAAHRGARLDVAAHRLEQVVLRHAAEHRVGHDHAERRDHLQPVGERLAGDVVEHDVGAVQR